jgi:O-antigen ligase
MVCAVIAALMLVATIFTKSRSGNLGLVAMLGVFLLVSRSLTPAMMIALVLGGMLALPVMPEAFKNRMLSIVDADKDPTGSREERRLLMEEAWQIFLANPLTGIGAGQFQNYSDPLQSKPWRETHNALLQVASELGIFGVIAFVYLIWRAFVAAWKTRGELGWIYGTRMRKRGAAVTMPEDGLDEDERSFLQTHGAAMLACMTGWLVCAFFASVAFNWTFYYLLGLSVTAYDVVRTRRNAYAQAKRLGQPEMAVA